MAAFTRSANEKPRRLRHQVPITPTTNPPTGGSIKAPSCADYLNRPSTVSSPSRIGIRIIHSIVFNTGFHETASPESIQLAIADGTYSDLSPSSLRNDAISSSRRDEGQGNRFIRHESLAVETAWAARGKRIQGELLNQQR